MIYRIETISTDEKTGLTYFLVHFWRTVAGPKPDRVNDFVMQLRPTLTRIVTKNGQWKKSDGTFVDKPETIDGISKWEWETIDIDLPSIIEENIRAYWDRAEKNEYPADHTSRIRLTSNDPHGVLARSDVMAMKDVEK